MSSAPVVKAFCVGQAKSGTASLAGLLSSHYRAAHEPERAQTLAMILRESHGDIDVEAFRSYLRARARRLNLDYDIAWGNQFIIRHLTAAFPDATFVVLIRDPYTWLQSTIGHLAAREIPADVRAFLDWWFRPDLYPHTRHTRRLEERGLYSVEAFLRAWDWHVTACRESIPASRRLVLRTHELSLSQRRLAKFLEIHVERLDASQGHLNRGASTIRIETLLEREYLDEMVRSVCGENMTRRFPEVADLADACGLWS